MSDQNEINRQRLYEACDKRGTQCSVQTKKDKEGNIVALLVNTRGDSGHFSSLRPEVQQKVITWLKANIILRNQVNKERTSNGISHLVQLRTHIFLSNNETKEAMLRCGFYPAEVDAFYWTFCISKRSPICQKQEDGEYGLKIPECMLTYFPE